MKNQLRAWQARALGQLAVEQVWLTTGSVQGLLRNSAAQTGANSPLTLIVLWQAYLHMHAGTAV